MVKNARFFFVLGNKNTLFPSPFCLFQLVHCKLWPFSSNFIGHFRNFVGRFQNSKGRNRKNVRKKWNKQHVTFSKWHVVSSKTSTSFEKTPPKPVKISENCDFPNRWESHNSQQLSLSSKYRVKWRGTKRKLLLKTNSFFRFSLYPQSDIKPQSVIRPL